MEITTLLLVAVLLSGLLLLFRRDPETMRIKRMMDKLPGLPSYPIFGSVLPYMFYKSEDLWILAKKILIENRPALSAWFGPFPVFCVYHPEYVQTVLNNTKMIEKSRFYDLFHPWIGTGLFTATGLKWHTRRRMITPSFHFKVLENFLPIFAKNCDILVNKLKQEVGGNVFDVEPYISACALDIICESAMGTSVNAQEFKDSDYIQAVNKVKEIVSLRISKPYLLIDFIFNLTKWGKIQTKSLKIIHDFTRKVIKERKEQRVNDIQPKSTDDDISFGQKKRVAFLDMLLDVSENGEKLTDNDIKEEVDAFMFGGHDTVTAAISFSVYLLGLHLDIQNKVYQELEDIFQGSDRSPSLQDLHDMKYMHLVIKESLRLFPIAPLIARKTSHDFQLESAMGTSVNVQQFGDSENIEALNKLSFHATGPKSFTSSVPT